jgi:hypothetical protein
MWLKDYWALFATQILETDKQTYLQNPNLPILEVNSGYGDNLALLQSQAKKLQRPACLVSSKPLKLEQMLFQGAILDWQAQPVSSSVYIEQVPWTQASALAQIWCEMHQCLSWHGLISLEIARVMQKHPDLCAYLALESEQPTGMLLAMPRNGWHNGTPAEWFSNQPQGAVSGWWAGRPEIAEALFDRVATDFFGLEVSVPKELSFSGTIQSEFAVFGFDDQLESW